MAGRVTVLTPVDNTPAIELGPSTWRKKILPVGWLNYDDGTTKKRINFTPDYLRNLVTSFKEKAFDGVPLQLGATHNNDPENTAGQIIGLDSDDSGLYATVTATDRADQLIKDNENLGVSVRIVEDYERQDGQSAKQYPVALQHVLATWTPRVKGLGSWQAVSCADETDGRFIDLSDLVFTTDGTAVAPTTSANPGGVQPTPEESPVTALNEEELAAVRSIFPLIKKLAESEGETAETKTGDKPTVVAPVTPIVKPATATPIVAAKPVVEQKPTEGADEDAAAEQAIAAATGDGENKVVDLALVELRSTADRQAIELAEMRAERDQEKWNFESHELVSKYGIPPAIVNLAEPLLKGARHVVELADGGSVDAGAVMRSVLTTVAKQYGRKIVDLSAATGTALEADAADEAKADQERILAAAKSARFGQ